MRYDWTDPEPAELIAHKVKLYLAGTGHTRQWLADQFGINRSNLYRRLVGNTDWKDEELKTLHRLLAEADAKEIH